MYIEIWAFLGILRCVEWEFHTDVSGHLSVTSARVRQFFYQSTQRKIPKTAQSSFMYVLITVSTEVLHCLAPLTTDQQTRRFVFCLNVLRQLLIVPGISVSKQHTAFVLHPEERGKRL